jgi:integrase
VGAVLRLVAGEGGPLNDDRHARSSVLAAHLDFLRHLNRRPGTIAQRRNVLLRLARFHDSDFLDITHEQITAFKDRPKRSGEPRVAASKAVELAHFRSFYRWAVVVEELVDRDPTARVPRPRTSRGLPHPIPEDELAHVLEVAPERIRPWYLLAAYAGLRACEIAPLRGEDIWWHHDPELIVIREGKGGEPGTVPLHPLLRTVLGQLPRRGLLFSRADGNPGANRPGMVSQHCNKHLHRIGSAHTLHSCRHRFGTLVYRLSGGDLRLTQELMRHKSPVTTAIYTLIDQSEAAEVVAALPRLVVVETERRAS